MAKKVTDLGVEIDYSEYWKKRKKEKLWARLLLNYERLRTLLSTGQLTLEDFCNFLFESERKSEIAIKMIKYIKEKKKVYFKEMTEELDVPRSTAWQVYISLKRAGILSRKTKKDPIILSEGISSVLKDLYVWWEYFVRK
jgi:hypothetical protein